MHRRAGPPPCVRDSDSAGCPDERHEGEQRISDVSEQPVRDQRVPLFRSDSVRQDRPSTRRWMPTRPAAIPTRSRTRRGDTRRSAGVAKAVPASPVTASATMRALAAQATRALLAPVESRCPRWSGSEVSSSNRTSGRRRTPGGSVPSVQPSDWTVGTQVASSAWSGCC